ncbi:MAG: hypothetical protein IJE84_05435, partial [Clostridia bacterium]|nr:hypothetical protein [Clostridia bacterium]
MNKNQELKQREKTAQPTGRESVEYRRVRSGKRSFSLFYTIYFSFVGLFIIAAGFGLYFLSGILGEYEDVQPKYKAEEVFAEHFATPDIAGLIEISGAQYATFEPHDQVVAYLAGQIEGKSITYAESSVKEESDVRTYNVFCDGVRFGTFAIREGEERTEHGFPVWEMSEIKLTVSLPGNSYSFLIPEGYVLSANGTAVPDRYIAGEGIVTDAYKLTDGKSGVKYIPYTVSGFLSAPTFTVRDKEGADAALTYDEQSSVYTVGAGSLTVLLPEGYTAYVDGAAIPEQYKDAEFSEASVLNALLCEGVAGINYVKYAVGGFIDVPTVTAKDGSGAECKVIYDEQSGSFEVLPSYSETLRAEHEEWILKSFETFTLYIQTINNSRTEFKALFDTSGVAWKTYSAVDRNWNWEATSYTFENKSVDEFIEYDE